MTLSRFLTLSFLCLLVAPKTQCAAESTLLDHDPNDAAFEKLTQKSMLGKVSDYCARSRIVCAFNDAHKPFEESRHAPLAPEHIQQWAQRAQRAVGIKEHKLVPVREEKLDDACAAEARHGSIVLNKTQSDTYSTQNFTLHHEAVHIKYNDLASDRFLTVSAMTIIILLAYLPQKNIILENTALIGMAATVGILVLCDHLFYRYRERRADIEGFLATQCHQCVTEYSEQTKTCRTQNLAKIARLQQEAQQSPAFSQQHTLKILQRNIKQDTNYLSPEECDIIAHRLKKENKICEYHAKRD